MSVCFSQDCIEGIEVELWGECYTITFTTYLDLSDFVSHVESLQ